MCGQSLFNGISQNYDVSGFRERCLSTSKTFQISIGVPLSLVKDSQKHFRQFYDQQDELRILKYSKLVSQPISKVDSASMEGHAFLFPFIGPILFHHSGGWCKQESGNAAHVG